MDPQTLPAKALSRCLALMGGHWKTSGRKTLLDPNTIIAQAWNAHRLARSRDLLIRNGPASAPRIVVTGYRLGEQSLYVPSDGIHRTVAAREAGQKVRAEIGGYFRCDPSEFRIDTLGMWQQSKAGSTFQFRAELDEEMREVLRVLGVAPLG